MSIEKVFVSLELEDLNLSVGELVLHNKKYIFKFDTDFLSRELEISPFKMKLSKEALRSEYQPFDGVFGVFNDSLPDGWGRLLLDRTLIAKGKSLADITLLDRLAYVGKNGMGALVYEPEEQFLIHKNTSFDLDNIYLESTKIINDIDSEYIEYLFEMGGSSGGARPKILIGYEPNTNKIVPNEVQLKPGRTLDG